MATRNARVGTHRRRLVSQLVAFSDSIVHVPTHPRTHSLTDRHAYGHNPRTTRHQTHARAAPTGSPGRRLISQVVAVNSNLSHVERNHRRGDSCHAARVCSRRLGDRKCHAGCVWPVSDKSIACNTHALQQTLQPCWLAARAPR
jgi:hypothetical protein